MWADYDWNELQNKFAARKRRKAKNIGAGSRYRNEHFYVISINECNLLDWIDFT